MLGRAGSGADVVPDVVPAKGAAPVDAEPVDGILREVRRSRLRPVFRPELVVLLVGALVLAGWSFDVTAFKSVTDYWPTMKANTAITIILAAVALLLLRPVPQRPGLRMLGHLCAVVVMVIPALTLSEYIVGWNLGIDQLLFHESQSAVGTAVPGRMGANSTVILILDSLALLLLDVEWRRLRPSEVLALASGTVGLVAFAGYAFGAYSLSGGFGAATRVALHASIAFVAISAGVLLARPNVGLMAFATSPGAGGQGIRRLLLPTFGGSLALGWVLYRGQEAGLYEPHQTLALLVVAVTVLFMPLLWLTATSLERADSDRRRAEVALEQHARQLEATNAELDAFSYSVSHDLRAPLRGIDGFSRILLDEEGSQLSPGAQRYLRLIREGAQRMGELIDGLLGLAQVGRRPLVRQTVDTSRLVAETIAELEPLVGDREIEFRVAALPACQADPTLLRVVFSNLLSNAVKYTRTRPHAVVEVGAASQAEGTVFWVRDNGVGFDQRYADRLFGVFQRLHRAEDYEGVGIGLATVQRIVARHGGRVWAESTADSGTTFRFALNGGTHV
jgi:signal transduction histidine kinase